MQGCVETGGIRRLRSISRLAHPRGMRQITILTLTAALFWLQPSATLAGPYGWQNASQETLEQRIAPPPGFARQALSAGSFGHWLRALPLTPAGTPVRLFNGNEKHNQTAHHAVVDIDIGTRDLQQCADAVMRLRAEWLLSRGNAIAFNDTSGKRLSHRPPAPGDRSGFAKYMTRVFAYAGTYSLSRELKAQRVADLAPGDVFIKGGFPGHAVLVVDVVEHSNGEKRFLLMQSYMPAQSMHVLKNPADSTSPWYALADDQPLLTPEWDFAPGSLRTW
jgi:Domain of unknown function (4846)